MHFNTERLRELNQVRAPTYESTYPSWDKKTHDYVIKFFLSLIVLSAFAFITGYNLYSAQMISLLSYRIIKVIAGEIAFASIAIVVAVQYLIPFVAKVVLHGNNEQQYSRDVEQARDFYSKRMRGELNYQRPTADALQNLPPAVLKNGTNNWINALWHLIMKDTNLLDRVMNADLDQERDPEQKNFLMILQQSIVEYERAQLTQSGLPESFSTRIRRMMMYNIDKQKERVSDPSNVHEMTSTSQEDLTEVLGFILHCLKSSHQIQTRSCITTEEGQPIPIGENISCEDGHYYSSHDDEDNGLIILQLDVQSDVKFHDLFKKYMLAKNVSLRLPISSTETHEYHVTQTKHFVKDQEPAILYIIIQRGISEIENGERVVHKKDSKIEEIPHQLNLMLSDGSEAIYQLQGYTSHVGQSAADGHYVAYVQQDRRFYLCDPIQEKIITLEQYGNFSERLPYAYLLQYVRN